MVMDKRSSGWVSMDTLVGAGETAAIRCSFKIGTLFSNLQYWNQKLDQRREGTIVFSFNLYQKSIISKNSSKKQELSHTLLDGTSLQGPS